MESSTTKQATVTFTVYKEDHLHTYHDLVRRFGWSYRTVRRWFRNLPRFRPSSGTVRISESVLQEFINSQTYKNYVKTKQRKN